VRHSVLSVFPCVWHAVQINAGTEMLEGEEFGDDNFDFDEDADGVDDMDGI